MHPARTRRSHDVAGTRVSAFRRTIPNALATAVLTIPSLRQRIAAQLASTVACGPASTFAFMRGRALQRMRARADLLVRSRFVRKTLTECGWERVAR